MDSGRYRLAKTIFFEACERPPGERGAFVERMCAGDEPLRAVVLQLLSHDEDPLTLVNKGSFREHLERLADSSQDDAPADLGTEGEAAIPERIGRYRILGILGRGGMGVVYLAEQENPRRQVALKVIAPGQTSRHMLRRFEHETQILGRLHHPGIAQIYEAGTHDAGLGAQPYFAMELICGRLLPRYCEESAVNPRARLELFIAICDAVQHAHQQGVVHRDLKPANIMVVDGHGLEASRSQPKILDFGVARLTDSDVQVTSMHTAADQIIGTLAYMSPEQLSGRPDEVDTRSDVYALGVILFELLSGRLPHDVTNKTMPETIRIIGQEEPTALSSLNRACRGDLDTIVGKALEREKARRYQSAGQLASDVRRFLHDEPIHARPPSTLYQLRKFARRNRALVVGVAGVFLMLILGIIGTTWQARQAIAARDQQAELRKEADANAERASISAAKATAVNAFLRRMLVSATPESAQGRDVLVAEVLDAAGREIGSALASQPDVEATIRLTLGETYLAIGRVHDSQIHLDRALEISRREHGEPSAEVAQALMTLASAHNLAGDHQGAIDLVERALSMFRSVYEGDHVEIATCLANLAEYRANQAERTLAVALKRESLEMFRRLYGDENVEVAEAQSRLAGILHNPAEAEPLVRQALATFHDILGERHPRYIRTLRQAAGMALMRRAYDEAAAAYHRALELGMAVYGPNHPENLVILQDLGFCHGLAGQTAQQMQIYDRAVEMARSIYGEDSMRTAEALMDRADVRAMLGEYDASIVDHRAALDIARRIGQEKDPRACVARLSIASELLRARRDLDEAESLCHEVLTIMGTAPTESKWMYGQALSLLGEAALQRQSYAQAEQLLLLGFERLGTSRLTANTRRSAASRLVRLYESWDEVEPETGKNERADHWRARLEELSPSPPAPTVPAASAPAGGT